VRATRGARTGTVTTSDGDDDIRVADAGRRTVWWTKGRPLGVTNAMPLADKWRKLFNDQRLIDPSLRTLSGESGLVESVDETNARRWGGKEEAVVLFRLSEFDDCIRKLSHMSSR
jgi:hypothetical protein